MAPTVLSLFTGIGGLDIGLKRFLPTSSLLGCVERDSYAAAVLLARMEDASMDAAPVFVGDIADVSGYDIPCDIVTASCPCQPFSAAGKREGTDDERHLWPEAFRVIQETDCSVVFLEQVSSGLRPWLPPVLHDLAEIGFDARWTCFPAADIGAPHRRERLFVLAWRASDALADGEHAGLGGLRSAHDRDGRDALGNDSDRCDPPVGDAERAGLEVRGRDALTRSFPAPWPPSPSDRDGWEEYVRKGGPQPVVRGGSHGAPSRVDRLRCLGNAVVPQQAEEALRRLWEC